ncbi:MAG: hypothetical protein ACP5EK_00055 [Thermoplasmatota archaeon]
MDDVRRMPRGPGVRFPWGAVAVCLLLALPVAGMAAGVSAFPGSPGLPPPAPDGGVNESLSIARPRNGLYLFDLRVLPLAGQIVVGTVTVEAVASEGIQRVEFLLKPQCGCRLDVMHNDTQPPFQWRWSGDSERVFDDGLVIFAVWGYDAHNRKVAEDTMMLVRLPL